MTKFKSLNKNLLFIALAFVMLVASVFAFLGGSTITSADSESVSAILPPVSNSVQVTAKYRTGGDYTNVGTGTFDGIAFETFNWKDISHFAVSYTDGSTTIAPAEEYNYSLSVQFLQVRPVDGKHFEAGSGPEGSNINPKVIFSSKETVSSLSEIPTFDVYVDTNNNQQHEDLNYGWGVYRFTLTINNTSIPTKFFFVRPSSPTDLPTPQVGKQILPSTSGLQNDYNFFIKTDTPETQEYKYIDQNLIKWFVEGKTSNGTKYVYKQSDLSIPAFQDNGFTQALYPLDGTEENRTGLSFHLNTLDVAGEWNVYCVIYDEAPNGDVQTLEGRHDTKSNPETVISGRQYKASYIIYIIIAGAVVLLAIIILIIVKSVKKEKVW